MRFHTRLVTLAVFLPLFAVTGFAGVFSFNGNFVDDNDVQLFNFTLSSPNTVTFQTWGFGGGTNANGQVISSGGFESILQVYDSPSGAAEGGPIFPGPSPTCPPRIPDPNRGNACQDAFAQILLQPGNYLLALTQNANAPLGNLSDGFFFTTIVPDPAFNNHFVGSGGFQGDSHWAVDILFVDAATEGTASPEPASALLVAGSILLVGSRAWRIRTKAGPRQ